MEIRTFEFNVRNSMNNLPTTTCPGSNAFGKQNKIQILAFGLKNEANIAETPSLLRW